MARLTEDDFSPVYMDVRKNGAGAATWPKIVLWALDAPLVYGDMQVMLTVLQRQREKYGEWEFRANIKPNDHTISTSEEQMTTDQFAEVGVITTSTVHSFAECMDEVEEKLEELRNEYL